MPSSAAGKSKAAAVAEDDEPMDAEEHQGRKKKESKSNTTMNGDSPSSSRKRRPSDAIAEEEDEEEAADSEEEENGDDSKEEVEFEDDDEDDSKDEDEPEEGTRRSRRVTAVAAVATSKRQRSSRNAASTSSQRQQSQRPQQRTSSRTTKFTSSMAEPSGTQDISSSPEKENKASTGGRKNPRRRAASTSPVDDFMAEDDDEEEEDVKKEPAKGKAKPSKKVAVSTQQQRYSSRNTKKTSVSDSLGSANNNKAKANSSPYKSPARRHARARRCIQTASTKSRTSGSDDDDESDADEEEDEKVSRASSEEFADSDEGESEEGDDDDEEEPLKIQRIVACRTETQSRWKEICKNMQTSEIEYGSRWFQEPAKETKKKKKKEDKEGEAKEETGNEADASENDKSTIAETTTMIDAADDSFEERFLVKWKDLSFLHCSWETQNDLELQIEGAKTYLNTFFRKSENGLLFSADERCDGDYFDPAFTQIDRILEVEVPEEDGTNFGIIMDKADPNYENGTGRQFLIKWCNQSYSEATYEFERDLILNDNIEYKSHVELFDNRNLKMAVSKRKELLKKGEAKVRHLYKTVFAGGNGSNSGSGISAQDNNKKDEAVEAYRRDLENITYKNGGKLRDYQAEGVVWMISNFIQKRSVILADEMGLGKTLQTAATVNIWTSELQQRGPVLIIAPLSTLAHWKREFISWTDLNVIVYHGSAEDRKLIRETEFVYECDRPEGGVAFNQTYLKKCVRKRSSAAESPWMAQVVITTPEMVVCDDSAELAAVQWEILVVDEAHRLKNHNSKLTLRLNDDKFDFKHKILLTGTPIQNDVQEFWTLLNFVDPDGFESMDDFMDKYGDLKSKERIDELHEEIRPYILRRLKEDVEKSVPPKEETLIEVELTISQKQYYRALYEKNVAFLHKNKAKALDGPSLNNLAMQLRKCCNHLFLLNGVEPEFRKDRAKAGEAPLSEGDLLVQASGKLVLLDKLLPRLREHGHRLLIFSQFKIMLDVLEDYLQVREMKFERIDGSITGNKRQQAIDRFQAPSVEGKEPPFIMMLSTRAGGVGINLTAADTVIIFDSDFNPQNDLQAQARCHRIGQTKSVKVFRLLTSKTYEIQLFHMSSMKMGLDQAVLKGFESGASEASLSKKEVEKLLRHGAYDMFNEDKAGTAEAESNEFAQQDIDSILQRRSRTVVYEGTGSENTSAGGTFSKASFKATKSPGAKGATSAAAEDVDIEDPDFWKKMLGEAAVAEGSGDLTQPRRRTKAKNYAESAFTKDLDDTLQSSAESSSDEDEQDEEGGDGSTERSRWGGSASKNEWKKDDAESVIQSILTFGYGARPWDELIKQLEFGEKYSMEEVKRMYFSISLLALLEFAEEEVSFMVRRMRQEAADNDASDKQRAEGGILAHSAPSEESKPELDKKAFEKVWGANLSLAKRALEDALAFAKCHEPRAREVIEKTFRPEKWKPQGKDAQSVEIEKKFNTVWQSLQNRGWKSQTQTSGPNSGKTRYEYGGKQYWSHESVLRTAKAENPDLAPMCDSVLVLQDATRKQTTGIKEKEKSDDLSLKVDDVDPIRLRRFLEKYGSLQLLADHAKSSKVRLSRKIVTTCVLVDNACLLVDRADARSGDDEAIKRLTASLSVRKGTSLPHPMWTSRHDAILIHAITKHGWIDQDSRLRAIAEDPTISWGAPFEIDKEAPVQPVSERKDDPEELGATASRAAIFINRNREMIEEFKGFDENAVKRAYCLTRQMANNEESESLPLGSSPSQSPSRTLQVNEEALFGVNCGTPGENALCPSEPVDLPTTKELQKRAKTILAKTHLYNTAPSNNSANERTACRFSVLDQGNRCNTLLAQMLTGLLKASSTCKQNRKLCNLAHAECLARIEDIQALLRKSPEFADVMSKSLSEMEEICKHCILVQRNLTKAPRYYKNVLRVILGEDPHLGRSPGEGLFPVERSNAPFPSLSTQVKSSKAQGKPSKAANTKASGERAIDAATRMVYFRNERENGQISSDSAANFLELTEIETLILSVACSKGLPVWDENWRTHLLNLNSNGRSEASGNPYSWTWVAFGQSCANLAQELFLLEKGKLSKTKKRESSGGVANTDQMLWNAKRIYVLKERAAEQAADYASEPDTLAKKTIMMVAKMQRYAGKPPMPQPSPNELLGHGSSEILWLDSDIQRWAASLDLLDNVGLPLAFTAIDFLEDLPEQDQAGIEISAIVDSKGSRGIMSQMCLMTRLRAIFKNASESGTKSSLLDKAAKSMISCKWDPSQPVWWGPDHGVGRKNMASHDRLLLERLLHSGFANVLDDIKSYGLSEVAAAKVAFKDTELTKGAIQIRACQLMHELHSIESSNGSSFGVLEEVRQERVDQKIPALITQSQASTKGNRQKGISSYFQAAADNDGQESVQESDDEVQVVENPSARDANNRDPASDDSDVEIISPPNKPRGKDGNDEPADYSDVEVVDPPAAKRKDDGKASSDDSSESPEKKLRTGEAQ